jgi:hypothetical protein
MGEEDSLKTFIKASKQGEAGNFQDSLNLFNKVFLFHPEGAIAYKWYFYGLTEENLEDRMRYFERAKESFSYLVDTIKEYQDQPGMEQILEIVQDQCKGLEGARTGTLDEFQPDKNLLSLRSYNLLKGT